MTKIQEKELEIKKIEVQGEVKEKVIKAEEKKLENDIHVYSKFVLIVGTLVIIALFIAAIIITKS